MTGKWQKSWDSADSPLPFPDWQQIAKDAPEEATEEHPVWARVARQWMARTARALGGRFRVRSSEHFLLVSALENERADLMLGYLEDCLVQIRQLLPVLVPEGLLGLCPVLVLTDLDEFLAYLSPYYPEEGEFAEPGGVYLNRGYGHFVMPAENLEYYGAVFAHELCHALLAPLDLPLWLDEAITSKVEYRIAGGVPYILDREMVDRHHAYWNEDRVQDFWVGASFHSPDDGQELSYHLAEFLFNALGQAGHTPLKDLNDFILAADRCDAGRRAALDFIGIDLAEVLEHFLGGGNWRPNQPLESRDWA